MSVVAYKQLSKIQLIIGILQFASSWLIIGYVWSVGWGVLVIWKKLGDAQQSLLPKDGQPMSNQGPFAAHGGAAGGPNPFEQQQVLQAAQYVTGLRP